MLETSVPALPCSGVTVRWWRGSVLHTTFTTLSIPPTCLKINIVQIATFQYFGAYFMSSGTFISNLYFRYNYFLYFLNSVSTFQPSLPVSPLLFVPSQSSHLAQMGKIKLQTCHWKALLVVTVPVFHSSSFPVTAQSVLFLLYWLCLRIPSHLRMLSDTMPSVGFFLFFNP